MLPEFFAIIGLIVTILSGVSYLIDTIRGRVKPNRVTWFLWGFAPMIAFAAEIGEHVGIQSLITFIVGFNPMIILIASFLNKKAEWKLTRFDLFCGVLSVLGILFWIITKSGNIAIFFSVVADIFAAIPTIVKSYKHPETESAFAYLLETVGVGMTILTIRTWTFATYAFPLWLFTSATLLTCLIYFKIGKRFK